LQCIFFCLGNLLSYDGESKRTFLESEFFFRDTNLESLSVLTGNKKNAGAVARYNKFKENQPVQMRAKLHCDLFATHRELLTNVPVTIKLTKNSPQFYMIGTSVDHEIYIEDCFLRVRRITVSNHVMLEHALALEVCPAQYPIRRTVVKV
jgi:hypothetical protein